jgi:hypothetical protein
MTRTPHDAHTLHDHDAAIAAHEVAATGKPTTCEEVATIWRGKELHAAGEPRPTGSQIWFHYKERYPWLRPSP